MKSLTALLDDLKTANLVDENCGDVHPPQEIPSAIPVLSPSEYLPINEELKARFEFCDKWMRAHAGQSWLNVHEMKTIWEPASPLAELVEIRREFNLEEFDPSRITLFACDLDEYNDTYLIWDESGKNFVIHYFHGHDCNIFESLASFVEYWLPKKQ